MKLCDFGLSLSGSAYSSTGGTVAYMPPEALKLLFSDKDVAYSVALSTQSILGQQRASFAVDVFSMGIIVWEVGVCAKDFSPLDVV